MQVRFLHCPPPNNLKLIMTPHPHKDILIAIANGTSIEEIEVKHTTWTIWQPSANYSVSWMDRKLASDWQVRIKPKTMLFNRQQLPMPMEATPEEGTIVYVPDLDTEDKTCWMAWGNTKWQEKMLAQGRVHSTKEAAIAWANAMIPFNNK